MIGSYNIWHKIQEEACMAFITDKIKKNAEECREYVEKALSAADKDGILFGELQALVKSLVNVAPGRKDFEKVYGMSPSDYFMKQIEKYR